MKSHLKLFIGICFALLFYTGYSQDSLGSGAKIVLSFNAGYSGAVGNFGSSPTSSEYNNEDYHQAGGFSTGGLTYNLLTGINYGKKRWQVELLVSYTQNSMNMPAYLGDAGYAAGGVYIGANSFTLSKSNYNYSICNVMPGIARTFIGDGATFIVRFLAGYSFVTIPGASGTYITYNNMQSSFTINPINCRALVGDFGIGIRFNITPYLVGLINADAISSSSLDYNFGNGVGLNEINITCGLGYVFNCKKAKGIN